MKNCLKFLLVSCMVGLFGINWVYGADTLFEKTSSGFFKSLAIAAVAPNGKYVAEASKLGGRQSVILGVTQQFFKSKEDEDIYNSIEGNKFWDPYRITFVVPYSGTELEKKIDTIKEMNTGAKIDTKRKIIATEINAHVRERTNAIVFSPDSKYLASAGSFDYHALDKVVKDEKGEEVFESPKEYPTLDVPVKIWEVTTFMGVPRLSLSKVLRGQKANVSYLAFSADGKRLASYGYKAIVWDVDTGNIISEKGVGMAYSMAFSPDGKTVAIGERDGKSIHIYSADTGEEVKVLTGFDKKNINSLAFSHDGKFLASAGHLKKIGEVKRKGRTIIIWNMTDWSSTILDVGHKYNIVTMAFSPDNKYLASGCELDNICIWDAGTGNLLEVFKKDVVGAFDSQIQFLKGGEIMYYDGKSIEIKRLKCESVSKE